MIDRDRQRLKASHRRDIYRREQYPVDRHPCVRTRRDRGEGRVFRHVFRVLLIMLVRKMTRSGAVMRMVRQGRRHIVMMHQEPAKRLMRMTHRQEQRDHEQDRSAMAEEGHQQGAIAQTASGVNLADQDHASSFTLRRRSALAITETELKLIAAPAMIGLRRIPNQGYKRPAAIGMPNEL